MSSFSRRHFLKTVGLGALACSLGQSCTKSGLFHMRKPNFVIIFIDDMGYADIEPFGQKVIKTPNLNRMAEEGRTFTNFYSASSVCSPSRASLLTGCYPTRVNVPYVFFPTDTQGLSPQEHTIAEALRNQGYATACIGKWHLGHKRQFLPTNQGFDHYLGIPYSNDMELDPSAPVSKGAQIHSRGLDSDGKMIIKGGMPPLYRDEEVIEFPADHDTLTSLYTEEAIKFIDGNKEQPFLLYLPHSMVHVPLGASPAFNGKSLRGPYGDAVEEIDWSVGQILECLKRNDLDQDTCVLFTSDNGPWLDMKENGGSADPLRGGKFTTYEGGMREPTIMWWPGTIPAGGTCDEVASTIDILPTFTSLAGGGLPDGRIIDGCDITPLITNEPGATSEKTAKGFYYYCGWELQAVRRGRWKLRQVKDAPVELFDLEADVGEHINMATQHPEIVRQLSKMMANFDAQLRADAKRRVPDPVGS